MTKLDEISKLDPGENIDALIAEKVMGWRIEEDEAHWKSWVDANGRYMHSVSRYDGYEDNEDLHTIFWHPSESILWAFEVVEKMNENGWDFNLEVMSKSSQSVATFCKKTKGKFMAINKKIPLAICRAALIALLSPSPVGP